MIPATSLTKHAPGSFRELLTLSLPLMLGGVSTGLMMFADRLILSYYSIPVMNAVVSASIMTVLFQYALISIASISEVFVGRYNGANAHHRLAAPVWQMVWFSLAMSLFFVPMGLFAAHIVLPEAQYELGRRYFQLMMVSSPMFGMVAALTGYYVGQGKTRKVMYLNILANIVNIVGDYLFIFGVEGYIPEMGGLGAAIGTVFGQFIILVGLISFLWDKKAIKDHNVRSMRFEWKLFSQCIKVGGANSVAHLLEMTAHSIVLHLLSAESELHMTAFSIGHSILLLVGYLNDGYNKAGMSIMSNFIGQNRLEMISKILTNMIKLHLVFMAIVALPLLLFPKFIAATFLGLDVNSGAYIIQLSPKIYLALLAFLFIDGMAWIYATVFTAAGDTIFMMLASAINVWLFDVFAIYLSVRIYHLSPAWVWYSAILFVVMNLTTFFIRYQSGAWKRHIKRSHA